MVTSKKAGLLISCLLLGLSLSWLVFLVRTSPHLREHMRRIEDRGLRPEALFYTEEPAVLWAEKNLLLKRGFPQSSAPGPHVGRQFENAVLPDESNEPGNMLPE